MERIEQPKTAVPLEVQRVLDAMTEENWWTRGGSTNFCGRACFLGRAAMERGLMQIGGILPMSVWTPALGKLNDLCRAKYRMDLACVNDLAASLSDFKSKIIALYQEGS